MGNNISKNVFIFDEIAHLYNKDFLPSLTLCERSLLYNYQIASTIFNFVLFLTKEVFFSRWRHRNHSKYDLWSIINSKWGFHCIQETIRKSKCTKKLIHKFHSKVIS